VVEENSGWAGNGQAPFLGTMMAQGEYFSNYHAVSHPSEPNYMAMFSGSTQGTDGSDSCITSPATSLAGEAVAAGVTIEGYFQGLTSNTLYGCRHNPFSQFSDAKAYAADFTAFPSNYATLPQISFVVANTQDDMGDDGTITDGDTWDQANLGSYAQWAKTNNSLLIIVSDESSTDPNYHTQYARRERQQRPLIAVGTGVTPGSINGDYYDHYSLLRTSRTTSGSDTSAQRPPPPTSPSSSPRRRRRRPRPRPPRRRLRRRRRRSALRACPRGASGWPHSPRPSRPGRRSARRSVSRSRRRRACRSRSRGLPPASAADRDA